MIDGVDRPQDPGSGSIADGEFQRQATTLRDWLRPSAHPAEPGRHHLRAARNCPWAHRALLARVVMGLEEAVSVSHADLRRTGGG